MRHVASRSLPFEFKRPHIGALVVAAVAAALHAIECFADGLSDAALGFFVWGMTPYCLCLLISALRSLRVAPVVGGVLALAAGTIVGWLIVRRVSGSSTPGPRRA